MVDDNLNLFCYQPEASNRERGKEIIMFSISIPAN
jgi:hypothetical protein